MNEVMGQDPKRDRLITCDEEAWLLARLRTLVAVALRTQAVSQVTADQTIIEDAVGGAINGAACEIAGTLGLKPCYVNLTKPRFLEL